MGTDRLSVFRRGYRSWAVGLLALFVLIAVPYGLIFGGLHLSAYYNDGTVASWVLSLAVALLCGMTGVIAVIGFIELRTSRSRSSKAETITHVELLLRLDERFRCSEYSDVVHRLQDGGKWAVKTTDELDVGPESDEDWTLLGEYVRLFEPIYFLASKGGISADLLRSTFGHRIDQLVQSKRIVNRMVANQKDRPWIYFLELWNLVDPQGYRQWNEFLSLWTAVRGRSPLSDSTILAKR
jgi:hypothetical protein